LKYFCLRIAAQESIAAIPRYDPGMAASTTPITLDEYLKTSYPDGDREFVDGEVVERPISSKSHSKHQRRLIEVFYELAKRHPFSAFPGLRVRVGEDRVRIPDVVIYAGAEPDEEVPAAPPYIAVEILSPDDRVQHLMEKLREYRAWGVAHIWVIDPQFKTMAEFGSSGLLDVMAYRLPEHDLQITFADLFPAA
jgi:Uma2 family endonuclease